MRKRSAKGTPRKRNEMISIGELIDKHSEFLKGNPYTYFELAYTRYTGWMVWICSNAKEADSNRKIIAAGQGPSPDDAAKEALQSLRAKGTK